MNITVQQRPQSPGESLATDTGALDFKISYWIIVLYRQIKTLPYKEKPTRPFCL
jgi:hypothetical protein